MRETTDQPMNPGSLPETASGAPILQESRGVWAAAFLGVAAATLPAVLPVMVGIFSDHLGLGQVASGSVASTNMTGVLVGTLLCSYVARHLSWAQIVRFGLAIMILGNLLTMLSPGYVYLSAMRFGSGVGEGMVGAICYGAMARSIRPERVVGVYFAGQSVVGMIGLGSFAYIATVAGWQSIFLLLSLLAAPGFLLADRIGMTRIVEKEEKKYFWQSGDKTAILALLIIFVYFMAMTSLWAFFERMSVIKGLTQGETALALSLSAFGGLIGSLSAGWAARKISLARGFAIGLMILVAGVAGISIVSGPNMYSASIFLFNLAWPFQYAFLFGFLARTDKHGNVGILAPLATGSGLAIGPFVGAVILSSGGIVSVSAFCLFCIFSCSIALSLLSRRVSST